MGSRSSTTTRKETPICGAVIPIPGAACIVSSRSRARSRSVLRQSSMTAAIRFAIAPYDSCGLPILRANAAIAARDRPTRQLIYDPNCEMAHRQEPFSLVVLSGWPPLGGCSSAAGRSFSFLEDCYARFQSHGYYGGPL